MWRCSLSRRLLVFGVAVIAVFTLSLAAEPAFQRNKGGGRDRGEREVPRKFRKLHDDLAGLLDRFTPSLDDRRGRGGSVAFGGEVLPANAHRGPGLLDDTGAFPGCLLYIDRLKDLGAGGVSISLSYPLMTDDYPRSAEYWSFYKRLTDEVRKRGLKLHIKTGPMFTEKEFTDVKTDYSKIDAPTYFRGKLRMNQRISQELRPDYLSIGNEPSSEMQIMKIKFTADDYTKYVSDSLRAMNRRGVLVGAGTGNWDSTDYVKKFARETDLDYIDIHIYPLASGRDDYMQRAREMAGIARSARKRLVIGEAWLYKASPRELRSNPTAPSIFARDVYSFWAPLDSEFLEAMARLGRAEGVEYISPFWTKYFFAYLDFGKTGLFAGPKQLTSQVDKAMVTALMAGKYSPTGEAYRRLAREYR